MLDRNGKEIRTGMIVRITGAYFKNDNGTYFVAHSPGDPTWCGSDYSLTKICRNGRISTAKYNLCFWPISTYVNSRSKRELANEHNKKYAEIEIIDTIPHKEVAEYFQKKAEEMQPMLNREKWDWGEEHPSYLKDKGIQDFYFDKAAEIRSNINIGNIK